MVLDVKFCKRYKKLEILALLIIILRLFATLLYN